MLHNIQKKSKRTKSKSFFYNYSRGYYTILIVPVLTIVLLFIYSRGFVKEQTQIASRNMLNQFFERIDDTIKDSYEICITIASNEKYMQYPQYALRRPGKTTFETWELSKLLMEHVGERYHDIFIYYPVDDRIVSGKNASLKLDEYYDIYYAGKNNDFREEFRKVAECAYGKPVLFSMNGTGGDSYLCMAMRQRTSKNDDKSFTIVIVLAQNYIGDILDGMENSVRSDVLMIHNAEKQVLLTTNENLITYNLSGYEGQTDAFEERIAGEEYVLSVRKSDAVDAYYTYAVYGDYYWDRFLKFYIICGIGAIFSAAIGMLVARNKARKVYQPIETLISKMQKVGASEYDEKVNTEFEFVESLFDKEITEKADMKAFSRRGQELMREKFVLHMLNGESDNSAGNSDDIFCENGICLCSDSFCVVVLSIEQGGGVERDLRFFVMSNVFGELLSEAGQGYMVLLPAGRYAILVNMKKESEENCLIPLLEQGREFLKQRYKLVMTLAVSSVKDGKSGIHAAYEEACLALRYKYLFGEENIIAYHQISGRGFEYVPLSESKLLFKVNDYLFGDSQSISARELVDEVLSDYGINQEASMETVDCFKFETVSTMSRAMLQGGYWSNEWRGKVQRVLESITLHDFKRRLTELLDELYQKQHEKLDERDACEKAFEYIEAHYSDTSMSLSLLGEMFEISPSYLSKLFKEKYHISIPDFITLTRIKGAKEQLRSTQDNIGKVAEDNGFLSSSVFIKTFKKLEGITPGMYREFHEKEK